MKLRFVRSFTLITTLLLVQPGIHPVYAQLNVEESLTPEELVDLLIGDGVSVSNISYTGADVAQGRFWGESNLGIDSGLILTSGRATNAIGPNTSTGISYNNGASGDPDLTQLANDPTNDASVLEFDFVPQSSNMQFSYVFGSDEYLEFVDSYNDAFGFFISGPGISGTFSNNGINIAVIPGTDNTYVTIDSVNNEDHSEFYYDNPNGQTIEYDGFTKGGMLWPVLRAIAEVTPCSTYHIKLTVGDAVDRALDSGVFLEANSFNAVGVSSTVNFDSPYIDSIAVEDCNSAQIKFSTSCINGMPAGIH